MPVSKYLKRLRHDTTALWVAVAVLCVLSVVTTFAAKHAERAAERAEVALEIERDNSGILDVLTKINLDAKDRAEQSVDAVVAYVRCLALIPPPEPGSPVPPRELLPLLDECARQAGLEPGPNPSVTPTTTVTTRPKQ